MKLVKIVPYEKLMHDTVTLAMLAGAVAGITVVAAHKIAESDEAKVICAKAKVKANEACTAAKRSAVVAKNTIVEKANVVIAHIKPAKFDFTEPEDEDDEVGEDIVVNKNDDEEYDVIPSVDYLNGTMDEIFDDCGEQEQTADREPQRPARSRNSKKKDPAVVEENNA